MTSNPPVGEDEQRWQQPDFQPDPEPQYVTPVSGRPLVPGPAYRPPPPSSFETVITTVAKLVWPMAILIILFTNVAFWPGLIGAIVLTTVLGAVSRNLSQRRRALPPPPAAPGGPDLR